MNLAETEKIINSLIHAFIDLGNLSLELRKKGLKKKNKIRQYLGYKCRYRNKRYYN